MKKSIIPALILLLFLTACHVVPDTDPNATSSVPASSLATLGSIPSSSVTPSTSRTPTTSIPTTSVPATNPPEFDKTGYTFIYKGSAPFIGIDPDCSGCTVSHLYWVDKTTEDVTPILEEPVLESIQEGAYVYYVKADEPTKVYRTAIGEFSKHEMLYESSHGKVSAMVIDTHTIRTQTILQFVADNKKFVILDLETGKDTVLLEQYYIKAAMFDHSSTDTWEEQTDFVFWGKLDENDFVQSYRYFTKTEEIREEGECAD